MKRMRQATLFDMTDESRESPVQESARDGNANAPLADRMRPVTLEDYMGQEALVGEGHALRQMIESDAVTSMILWGPPGVGKTTLARIIAHGTKSRFVNFSAVNTGVKDIRLIMKEAQEARDAGIPTILFVDEIHRFNKSQQDAFLPYVESGLITLIGATTENPSFELNSALLSRCRVFTLEGLKKEDLKKLLERALKDPAGLGTMQVHITPEQIDKIAGYAHGDARFCLNTLEMAVKSSPQDMEGVHITDEILSQTLSRKSMMYDKDGEQHYDIVSAMIKSIRGSDPDAALYYMARMLEGGEDPKFIARRLLISASEDIGLANPNAMLLANACFDTIHKIGMPEARIPLSECVIYLATSPKSNSAYLAIDNAIAAVKRTGNLPVPLNLRNAPTKLMKELNYGKGYQYPHNYPGHFVETEYLPEELKQSLFYQPQDNPAELKIAERLRNWWKKYRK